jgi:hypothetical protein
VVGYFESLQWLLDTYLETVRSVLSRLILAFTYIRLVLCASVNRRWDGYTPFIVMGIWSLKERKRISFWDASSYLTLSHLLAVFYWSLIAVFEGFFFLAYGSLSHLFFFDVGRLPKVWLAVDELLLVIWCP